MFWWTRDTHLTSVVAKDNKGAGVDDRRGRQVCAASHVLPQWGPGAFNTPLGVA